MNQHHLSGEQRLGLCMLVATVIIAIIVVAALVYARGRSIPSDTPTSLHP